MDRNEVIKELLETGHEELCDDDLVDMLLSKKISTNLETAPEKLTFGQRASDKVAQFAGSWAFIFSFLICMILWMVVNGILASRAFDPYPFILLNLVLSCIAAVQAPLIMMSQNRQEAKDRARAENDYRVNLKSEFIIDDLHDKLDEIIENQERIERELELLRDHMDSDY